MGVDEERAGAVSVQTHQDLGERLGLEVNARSVGSHTLTRVVLPPPLNPTIASVSPGSTVRLIFFNVGSVCPG